MDADREFHRIIAYSSSGSNMITEGMIDPLLTMFDDTFQNISTEHRDKAFRSNNIKQIFYIALEKKRSDRILHMYVSSSQSC